MICFIECYRTNPLLQIMTSICLLVLIPLQFIMSFSLQIPQLNFQIYISYYV